MSRHVTHRVACAVVLVTASLFARNEAGRTLTPGPLVALSDLTISSFHSGNFTQGQLFRSYTLTVSNVGGGNFGGTATVTDTVRAGLTVVSIGGNGWTCKPAKVTCTRGDALVAGASYPPIFLTVNVSSTAPVTTAANVAVVSGDSPTANNTSSDPTTIVASGAACAVFTSTRTLTTGDVPTDVAVGDFNGDGIADVAIAESSLGVGVALGTGGGNFGPPQIWPTDSGAYLVRTGDFNGDGIPDIATLNGWSVSILLGYGNATFAAPVNYDIASISPNGITIADVNGDGVLDIIVVVATGTGEVFLGNGNGTFATPPLTFTAGTTPMDVAAADFNGDGKIDLAIPDFPENAVNVLLGNGNGTFGPITQSTVGTGPRTLVITDLNGDGKPDIAVGNSSSNDVTELLGTGNGTFTTSRTIALGGSPYKIDAADFTGDGIVDLMVACRPDAAVYLCTRTAQGASVRKVFTAASGLRAVLAADLDGNGQTDMAVLGYDNTTVTIAFNRCPNLQIWKTHTGGSGGSFTQGQIGATCYLDIFSLSVNPGADVVVTEVPPAGITITAMSGSGWTCNVGTLRCSRSDVSPGGDAEYPTINVTVNVASNAPATVVNTATVSGGPELNLGDNTASDSITITPAFTAPTNLVATPISTSQVRLNWDTVTGAVAYVVYRRSGTAGWAPTGAVATAPPYIDPNLTPDTAYMYRIVAQNSGGAATAASNEDLATTTNFSEALVPFFTVVRAAHLKEIRTAVNAVRRTAGLGDAAFTDDPPDGVPIKAVHITELRTFLTAARNALLLPTLTFSDPSPTSGSPVKAVHFDELRTGVK